MYSHQKFILFLLVIPKLIKGHFGADYPWHTKILEELTARLEILSRPLDKQAKVTLRIGFI